MFDGIAKISAYEVKKLGVGDLMIFRYVGNIGFEIAERAKKRKLLSSVARAFAIANLNWYRVEMSAPPTNSFEIAMMAFGQNAEGNLGGLEKS